MASSSNTSAGVVLEAYEYQRYQTGALPLWTPLRFPGQYHDAETDLFENWNRYYDPSIGRYLQPEPMLVNPRFVVGMARRGFGAPAYAYAVNNPVNYVDPDGLKVMLMDEAAGRYASIMVQHPVGRYLYDLLDASPNTYEVWGRQDLGGPTGRFDAGGFDLLGMTLTSGGGGSIRVDEELCNVQRINPAGTMAHEFTHAALFEFLNMPRTWGGMAKPPIVEELVPHAFPNGGLFGDNMSSAPHGILNLYWLSEFSRRKRP
jgi:RHS repeat-associated protein